MQVRTPEQIVSRLRERFTDALLAEFTADKHPRVHINAVHWREIAEFLRRDPQLQFDWLANLSGVDYAADEQLCVVYDLWSTQHRHQFAVKVFCDRAQPRVPSVCDLWRAADWHEREAYDLFGIDFDGHPDLRRILLPEDWEGYPLRKDYQFPQAYHGIAGTVEQPWQPKAKK